MDNNLSITLVIILFTGFISYQGFRQYGWIDRLRHSPYQESRQKEWYRLLTSGFIHADWVHLMVNMFVLYSFGIAVEDYIVASFGSVKGVLMYIGIYVMTIIFANIPTLIRHKNNPGFASIGASGAVSGILFIFILMQPWATLLLFFIIPVPAIIAGVGYLIYSSWAARQGRGRIDHSAHFAGALAGMILMILLKPDILHHVWQSLFKV